MSRLKESSIVLLRDRVSTLFQLRAKRQAELAAFAEQITVLWDKLGVDASVREAWVLQNSGKITDNVLIACSMLSFLIMIIIIMIRFSSLHSKQTPNSPGYRSFVLQGCQ